MSRGRAVVVAVGPQLAVLLGPLRRVVLRRTRAAADLPELPEAQIELLRLLVATGGIAPREAAELLRVAPSTVSNLVRALTQADLVERRPSDTDGRAVLLTASAEARARLDRYDRASAIVLSDAVAQLAPADRRALERALPALSRLLDVLSE
ncbi:MarR family winged helix-turn-helix transcriptional regulator [Nocardia seriolae]|uniref:MarR family winged helix-turn-helix transcriptional regulator n=1 Tax=Nocardia seriolae TaxID=37332 RepID=UPI00190F7001|nr:MarR family transcriptional regulator [Nocardia seriolae]WNJ62491.1 MarR family transcriptional regulator [Nocardia seriolae]